MKSIIKSKYNPRIILKRFALFALPVLLLFNFAYIIVYNSQKKALVAEFEAQQHEAVTIVSHVLGTIFIANHNDLMLVKNSNEFTDYIQNPTEQTLNEMEQMLFRVIRSKPDFVQIRFIDTRGFEVARVNHYDNIIEIVPKDELQDKSEMYYIDSAIGTQKEAMYISNLDLNLENGIIMIPYEPVMRFAVPIYSGEDEKGILIINYDGYKILSILDEYVNFDNKLIEVGIFDSMYYWQFKKGAIKDTNVLTQSNIDELIPLSSRQNGSSWTINNFVKDDISYQIYFLENFGDVKVEFEGGLNHIGIISSFNLSDIIASSDDVILKYPIIPYVISLLIIATAIILIVLSYQNKTDSLMLAASQYISEFTHDGIVITDQQKKVIYCNNVFEDTFGYSLDEIKGREIGEFLRGDTKIALSGQDKESSWEGNVWEMVRDTTYILKFLKIKLIYNKRNALAYYIGIYSEPKVDQKVLDRATWEELSVSHIENNLLLGVDPIFNKDFDADKEYIVIVIKISEFIDIKYRIREQEGNRFILNIAGKLKKIVGEDGIVLAPGADLFLLRTRFHEKNNEVQELMESIDDVFTGISFSDYPSINISYLSGVAISSIHGTSGLELLTNAFIALEAIIKLKKTNYLIYNEDIYDLVRKDKTIRSELKFAFEKREFRVVYQVQKSTDGTNIGVEALVRWKNRRLGNVPPNLFVPIMEESEYINKLGMYVLKNVVDDFKTIKKIIPADFKISINLSSNEFMDKTIVSSLVDVISSASLRLDNFCFEITETTLVNNLDHTNEIIKYLHEKNIVVSIDDFGTGFSSLGYLKTLYADKLKIDRTFIKDYPEKDDGTMIKAIISLAKQLKKGVIVEGIETEEQLELIKSLKCKEYQGYYGSKPIEFKKFVDLFIKPGTN